MLIIGIDPGTNTGIAVKNLHTGNFLNIETLSILDAQNIVLELLMQHGKENIYLIFEDARKRKWFGNAGREKLQGAGSIKRDCSIWQEFCEKYLEHWIAQQPRKGSTKIPVKQFKVLTGWKGRTTEHARDAAMLIHAHSAKYIELLFKK